jgi:major membrane immunogen (membrane-anchored lipoprotein)
MKKRVLAVVLAALLLASLLAACGGSGKTDSKYVGKYYTSKISDWTVQEYADLLGMSLEEAKEFMWVELKDGGKGTFNSDGEAEEVSWKVEGEKLTLSAQGDAMEGTIKDGVITFDFDGDILILTKG